MEKALLDADFIFFLLDNNEGSFFMDIFNSLLIDYYVHIYIYEQELLSLKEEKKSIFEEKCLHLDSTQNKCVDITQYVDGFQDMYFYLNGERLFEDNDSLEEKRKKIFNHEQGKNRGEIHSVLSAFLFEISLFFSNDHSSQELVDKYSNKYNKKVSIKNVKDILNEFKKEDKKYKKEVRSLLKRL